MASGGVGLLIKKQFVTFIQSVKSWKDRILYIDLYLEGRIKIQVMVVYVPPTSSQNRSLRKETIKEIKKIIKESQHNNFKLILMGDFNSNHTEYYNHLIKGRSTSRWELLEFMEHNTLVDIHPSVDGISPATYEYRCVTTGTILC